MAFGAEVSEAGGVRFQLWAPAARRVEVLLEAEGSALSMAAAGGGSALSMAAAGNGWHRLVTDRARAGMRYRYRIDGAALVPDPASRFQPDDVHGPSEIVDPGAFAWEDAGWRGRPWEEMVFYELHARTFSPEGTFRGAQARLDDLVDLGITAVQVMPVADFPGRWNWGYDGALLFAPDSRYGRPDDLKAFVQACHRRGLAVFLDVVYNHFGPEGNYLGLYAPDFFDGTRQTPWGAAIALDGPRSGPVRAFFVENALYWLEEYRMDGLRLDAVHALRDTSSPHLLDEIAARVAAGPGAHRRVHLVLENDANEARYLRPGAGGQRPYAGQWNDDVHHALHVIVTGERDRYYRDYPDPWASLARCLGEGFDYQGQHSLHRGRPRGESTAGVPLTAFVSFLQNHDQIGNRPRGERVHALACRAAVRAATALLLLAPSPPLLFMGEEWEAREPFLFFCDFGPDLAARVSEGRRAEFRSMPAFADPAGVARVPDPQDPTTWGRSRLDWSALDHKESRAAREWMRHVLRLRQRHLVPHLAAPAPITASVARFAETGLSARWTLGDGVRLTLVANLGPAPVARPRVPPGFTLFSTAEGGGEMLGAWHVEYWLDEGPPA
jgi:malto-oligosyltrehalose trehalohydrolase